MAKKLNEEHVMEKIKKGYVVQILFKYCFQEFTLQEELVPVRVYVQDEAYIGKLLTWKDQIQIIWNEKGEIIWKEKNNDFNKRKL